MVKKYISFYYIEFGFTRIPINGDISFESLREHAFIVYNFINIGFGLQISVLN